MKEFDKHEFDEIFRSGLTAPDLNEVDEDWALMKARLQSGKNRNRIPYYMIFVSSVAAVLLLVFSVMFYSSDSIQDQGAVNAKNNEKVNPEAKAANGTDKVMESIPENNDHAASNSILRNPVPVAYTNIIPESKPDPHADNRELANNDLASLSDTSSKIGILGAPAAASGDAGTLLASIVATTEPSVSPVLEDRGVTKAEEQSTEKANPAKSRFSLAINFAPDLNGVQQLQSSKVSYSVGAGLIYKISNKLSIEAGAAYGKKIYQTGFSSFRPASYNLFQVKPNAVNSGFDVMDIQLNLAYTLLNKGKSSIGFGAGISSYLMLDEQYSFTYPNINARGLSSFSTGYQNNHFFGIANLNLSYKRSLANNIKLAVNPYLKLPLTDLGYGNIRLRSAGMSIGVITNLNKSKK